MHRVNHFCALATLLAVSTLDAQSVPADTALALPIKPVRTLSFTTDEGTWISLDVAPDGQRIVFDLLGDLYTIPIAGGKASRLTSGLQWDCMPRWSPDGRTVAFISDRDGSDNLWIVNFDGSGLRRLTKEVDNALSSPAWTPDGEYVVARRFGPYPTNENYLTNVPLWIYHREGGAGAELFPARSGRMTTNTGATFSPDGRFLYFGSHAGGYSGENIGQYQVVMFDRQLGVERNVTAAVGGGLRPAVSPDGRWMAYATRAGTRTALRLRDLRTSEDTWLVAETQRDDQEGYAPNDVLPSFSWTPDSRSVVFYGGGKIKRVERESRAVSVIPFSVEVELGMGERLFVPLKHDDGALRVTQLMHTVESPDGRRLVFSAIGKLWAADVNGTSTSVPRRLTSSSVREYYPAYSPDGQWIAYVTWSDSAGGFVWKTRANGSGPPVQLTTEPQFVTGVHWSPEGDRIVFTAGPRQAGLVGGPVPALGDLRWVGANGGPSTIIARTNAPPSLVTSNAGGIGRVYYVDVVPGGPPGFQGTQTNALYSVRYDGSDRRQHMRLTTPNAGTPVVKVAPDERAIIVIERDDVYLLPLTDAGSEGLLVNFATPSVPLRRLTNEGANYAAWSDNGRTVVWSFANHYYRAARDTVLRYAESSKWNPQHIEVTLTAQRSNPRGALVLRGARVITMRGDEVLESVSVVVENNRITQVGASVRVPEGARVIDVAGKTIIPGIVDVHAHPRTGRELAPSQEWSIAANLAYGVTTTRNPAGSRWNVAWSELIETGDMVGARIYATGTPLTSNNTPIKSAEDALHVVRRYKQQGVHSLKQYLQPRRIQRQWVLQAALAEKINTTNEGAGDLKADITMAIDGFTALEHSIGQVPLYKDVVTVFADSKIAYTPTLVVAYGGPAGDGYWRARTDLDRDPKVAYFTPADVLYRTRRRPLIVEEDYNFPLIARGVRDIVRAGGVAGLGSHGQHDGPAAHWELWMLQSGGMTNHEALRIATILGAQAISYGDDLGSIEVGKLADLVVLNSNPLENIRNSTDIRYVMKNGELFDAATLDRVWPTPRKYPTPPWVKDKEDLERVRGGR